MKNFEDFLNESKIDNLYILDLSDELEEFYENFISSLETRIKYIFDLLGFEYKRNGVGRESNLQIIKGNITREFHINFENDCIYLAGRVHGGTWIFNTEQNFLRYLFSFMHAPFEKESDDIIENILEKEPQWIIKYYSEYLSPALKEKYAHIFKNELF